MYLGNGSLKMDVTLSCIRTLISLQSHQHWQQTWRESDWAHQTKLISSLSAVSEQQKSPHSSYDKWATSAGPADVRAVWEPGV
jgi:hypothetical protein